jgi:pimeloyl-ACP methyl ester carboxylesterase
MGNDVSCKMTDFLKGYENETFLRERAKATASVHPSYFKGQIILYETFLNDVYMTDQIGQIIAPTLVICGDEDTLKPIQFSKMIHEKIKGSKLEILRHCGHVAIFEKTKEYIRLWEERKAKWYRNAVNSPTLEEYLYHTFYKDVENNEL